MSLKAREGVSFTYRTGLRERPWTPHRTGAGEHMLYHLEAQVSAETCSAFRVAIRGVQQSECSRRWRNFEVEASAGQSSLKLQNVRSRHDAGVPRPLSLSAGPYRKHIHRVSQYIHNKPKRLPTVPKRYSEKYFRSSGTSKPNNK